MDHTLQYNEKEEVASAKHNGHLGLEIEEREREKKREKKRESERERKGPEQDVMERAVEVGRAPRMREKECRDMVSNLHRHTCGDLCEDSLEDPLEG